MQHVKDTAAQHAGYDINVSVYYCLKQSMVTFDSCASALGSWRQAV